MKDKDLKNKEEFKSLLDTFAETYIIAEDEKRLENHYDCDNYRKRRFIFVKKNKKKELTG